MQELKTLEEKLEQTVKYFNNKYSVEGLRHLYVGKELDPTLPEDRLVMEYHNKHYIFHGNKFFKKYSSVEDLCYYLAGWAPYIFMESKYYQDIADGKF